MGKILKEYMWNGSATKLVSLSIFVAFLENMKFKKKGLMSNNQLVRCDQ